MNVWQSSREKPLHIFRLSFISMHFYYSFVQFISLRIKIWAPSLWRRWWGYPVPEGTRFEDYSENLKPISSAKEALGRKGEKYIFDRLCQKTSCRILACNVENYYCELDIVFLDQTSREIVFLEVKTRRNDTGSFAPETYAIDAKRKKKMALAGRSFRNDRGYLDYSERFDVVVVIMPKYGQPTLRYHKGFFNYSEAVLGYRGRDYGKNRSGKYLREDVKKRRDSHIK